MDLVPFRRRRGGGLARLHEEFDDLFRRFFGDWSPLLAEGAWAPELDVAEHPDKVVVKVDLPGVKNEDIEISVQGNTLIIGGEKKEQTEDRGEGYHHVERRYGSFHRTITLPAGVDPDKIEATYRDGVLSVTLPKDEATKAKRIKVKAD